MTRDQVADILEKHNLWRRGEVDDMPFNSVELGSVIDMAIRYLRESESNLYSSAHE